MFLVGLQKLGRGDWRGIARNFVATRTPTQVASHAQKYFLRQSNLPKRKRRSSLFDIPADAVGCLGGEPPFKVPARSTGFMSRSSSSPALHYLDNNHNHNHSHNPSQDRFGRTLSLRNTFIPLGNPEPDTNTANDTFLHLWPITKPCDPTTVTATTTTAAAATIAAPLLTITPSTSFNQPPPNSSPKEDTLEPGLTLSIALPSVTENNNMHINTNNTNNNNNSNNNQAASTCHGSPSKNRSLISVV